MPHWWHHLHHPYSSLSSVMPVTVDAPLIEIDGTSSAAGNVIKDCKKSPFAGSSVRSNLHTATRPSETCLSGLDGVGNGTGDMCVCLILPVVLHHPQLKMVWSCNPNAIPSSQRFCNARDQVCYSGKKWEGGAYVMSLQLLCTVCMPLPWVTSTDPQHLADAPSLQPFSSVSLAF